MSELPKSFLQKIITPKDWEVVKQEALKKIFVGPPLYIFLVILTLLGFNETLQSLALSIFSSSIAWLGATQSVQNWNLIILLLIPLPVFYFLKWVIRTARHAHVKKFTEGLYNDVVWKWAWRTNSSVDTEKMEGFCPTCDTELILSVETNGGPAITQIYCTSCNTSRGIMNVSDLKDHIRRKIERDARSGDWRDVIATTNPITTPKARDPAHTPISANTGDDSLPLQCKTSPRTETISVPNSEDRFEIASMIDTSLTRLQYDILVLAKKRYPQRLETRDYRWEFCQFHNADVDLALHRLEERNYLQKPSTKQLQRPEQPNPNGWALTAKGIETA